MNDTTTYDSTSVICPWCGHIHGDAWEWHQNDAEWDDTYDCEECGKPMLVSKTCRITYKAERGRA